MGKTLKTIIWTLVGAGLLGAGVALVIIYSGVYQIAANKPHMAPVRWLLTTAQQNAVREHAEGIKAPSLHDPSLIRQGFALYQENCLVCHGAPGVARAQIGRGLNPNPPPLYVAASEWSNAELYWIIKHGLKMAGMPAFDAGHSDRDLWAMTAFTRRLPELSVREYRAMVAALSAGAQPNQPVEWVDRDDPGYGLLLAKGNSRRGKVLLQDYGCGTCHVIPGIKWAQGKTGPQLTRWAERHYIAGTLLNNPRNLVAWVVNPQAIEPGTAMPALGVTPEQALDMAAYLYTLGKAPAELEAARKALDR